MAPEEEVGMKGKKTLYFRLKRRLYHELIALIQWPRIKFYRMISTAVVIDHGATILQPVLFSGKGTITLGKCTLGSFPSPLFFSGYMHIEAREDGSHVVIDDGVYINNSACIIAERSLIHIGQDTLLGPEVCIFDSDFHGLKPETRHTGQHTAKPVVIGQNVFLGARVTVLKGVQIGRNSIVGASTLINKNIPEMTIATDCTSYSERRLEK